MNNLLLFELRKIFTQISFYVCTLALIIYQIIVSVLNMHNISAVLDTTPTVADLLSSSGTYCNLSLFCSVIIAILICNDFSVGTLHDLVGRGYTRLQYFISKFVMTIGITLLYLIIGIITSFLTGIVYLDIGNTFNELFSVICTQYLLALAYTSFAFMISLMSGKIFISIIIGSLFPFIERLIVFLWDSLFGEITIHIKQYSLSSIEILPLNNGISQQFTIICSIYIAVFLIIAFLFFRWKEI